MVAHAVPDLYERIAPRPTTPFAQALRLALIDAAPDDAQDPVVVVLSPGIYSETAFDQAYLATLLGFPWSRARTWWCARACCGCARWAP